MSSPFITLTVCLAPRAKESPRRKRRRPREGRSAKMKREIET
jgi:hypothetical protein